MKRLKFWGWGYEDEKVPASEIEWMESTWSKRFGVSRFDVTSTPRAEDIALPKPRISIPARLAEICTTEQYERVLHSYSKSFPDIIRVYRRECPSPADVVALPRNEKDIINILEWCYEVNAAVVPFGGGSSVVGGVVPPSGGEYRGAVLPARRRNDAPHDAGSPAERNYRRIDLIAPLEDVDDVVLVPRQCDNIGRRGALAAVNPNDVRKGLAV